jgi:transcription antitermination factor NusG
MATKRIDRKTYKWAASFEHKESAEKHKKDFNSKYSVRVIKGPYKGEKGKQKLYNLWVRRK